MSGNSGHTQNCLLKCDCRSPLDIYPKIGVRRRESDYASPCRASFRDSPSATRLCIAWTAGIWNESDEESALASRAPQQVRLLLGPAFLLRLIHVGPFKAARKWQTDSSWSSTVIGNDSAAIVTSAVNGRFWPIAVLSRRCRVPARFLRHPAPRLHGCSLGT